MKKIILLSITLATLVTSCREEFLETSPTEFIGDAPVQTKLNGLYLMMVNEGTGGTDLDHQDFGQKSYDIYSDILSQDMAVEGLNYPWYVGLANMTSQVDFTKNDNYMPWRYYYRIIAGANDIIDKLGGTNTIPSSQDDRYAMGQAKALRAYAYFYLMQLFTKGYNPTEAAIPVYTKSLSPAAPKSTQEQVYSLIIDDLGKAVDYLEGFDRENKGMIDQGVAKGLLAYTYAAIGESAKAAVLSKEIIANYGYPITSRNQAVRMAHTSGSAASGGGFNDLATPSWMWGFDLQVVNGLDLVSWWGQVDVFTYSYAGAGVRKGIDLTLYNSMRADDIRRNQFITNDPSPSQNYPGNKFFDPNRTKMGQRQVTTDYIFMRVDEFHLLAAESLAKSGQENEAKTILKSYLSNRLTDTSYIDGLTGNALKDEIYKNTRLEFWGEGKSYLAFKRNKATATRGTNHKFFVGQSFSYDDERVSLKIPQEEILNNPNL